MNTATQPEIPWHNPRKTPYVITLHPLRLIVKEELKCLPDDAEYPNCFGGFNASAHRGQCGAPGQTYFTRKPLPEPWIYLCPHYRKDVEQAEDGRRNIRFRHISRSSNGGIALAGEWRVKDPSEPFFWNTRQYRIETIEEWASRHGATWQKITYTDEPGFGGIEMEAGKPVAYKPVFDDEQVSDRMIEVWQELRKIKFNHGESMSDGEMLLYKAITRRLTEDNQKADKPKFKIEVDTTEFDAAVKESLVELRWWKISEHAHPDKLRAFREFFDAGIELGKTLGSGK